MLRSRYLAFVSFWVGLVFSSVCVAPGCSNLIGLGGYSIGGEGGESEAGSSAQGGTSAEGGARNEAGRAGRAVGGDSASAGSAGDSFGEAGEGGAASAGRAGNAGARANPALVPADCNDDNECTHDACASGKCVHSPEDMTTACGTDQVCDGQGLCVRCLDTEPGLGATSVAPPLRRSAWGLV